MILPPHSNSLFSVPSTHRLVFNGRLAEARLVLERNQALLTYHFDPQFSAQLLELVTSVPAVTVKQGKPPSLCRFVFSFPFLFIFSHTFSIQSER